MVVLVNASVYDRCCSQTVLSWTIFDVGDDSPSLSNLFEIMTACRKNINSRKLEYYGPKKTSIPSTT